MESKTVFDIANQFLQVDPPVVVAHHSKNVEDKSKIISLEHLKPTHSPEIGGRTRYAGNDSEVKRKKYTKQVLSYIFPPRQWEEDGKKYEQNVSSQPASIDDVILLGEKLDRALKDNRANMRGLCPIKRRLLMHCFDEINRQEAIDCGERGLLITRIRNALNRILESYENLVDATVIYGMHKSIQAEEKDSLMEAEINELEEQIKELAARRTEIEEIMEQRRSRAKELREAVASKRAEELNAINGNLGVLEAYMERLVQMEARDSK